LKMKRYLTLYLNDKLFPLINPLHNTTKKQPAIHKN